MKKKLLTLLGTLFISSCASVEYTSQPQSIQNDNSPKKIIVFFDGTANDEASRTNVAKLHNLVSLRNRRDIHTIYIKGVGTENSPIKGIIGMSAGYGIGKDIRQGYEFIAERYQPQNHDQIYLFGFSRGAYAARILAGMIEVAGIPDISKIKTDTKKRKDLIERIYSAHKGILSPKERRENISKINDLVSQPADIEFMGLWDTVEALGVPTTREHVGRLNPRYFDQLCNIKHAAHALSIDDNRARLFTPVLLSQPELISSCNENINIQDIVSEVWFSGAHSDVGGGYHDSDLSGVSLNWMLGKIESYDLVPPKTSVYEDIYSKSHNPDKGLLGFLLYWNLNRNIPNYADKAAYPNELLPIHDSVIKRLSNPVVGKKWHEFNWIDKNNYPKCFTATPTDCHSRECVLQLNPNQQCFRIETTKH